MKTEKFIKKVYQKPSVDVAEECITRSMLCVSVDVSDDDSDTDQDALGKEFFWDDDDIWGDQ